MEKEGLRRSLDLLMAHGVTFDSIVTGRHPQIQKYLREANITQYYDVWHIEKGISSSPEYVLFMCLRTVIVSLTGSFLNRSVKFYYKTL